MRLHLRNDKAVECLGQIVEASLIFYCKIAGYPAALTNRIKRLRCSIINLNNPAACHFHQTSATHSPKSSSDICGS